MRRRTRFDLLPREITNCIFELAIKSYFSEKILHEIWYGSWKRWRQNICNVVDYKIHDRVDFFINYWFNSRGIYKSCFHYLYNTPLKSLWGNKIKIYSDDYAINFYIQDDGELLIDLCENNTYIFRFIVFTYSEYQNFFVNNDHIRNTIDVDENNIYKLCYLGIWRIPSRSYITNIETIHEFNV